MSSTTQGVSTVSVGDYVATFNSGRLFNRPIAGLAGRVIRGKKPQDFETFSDDPDRKIVMFLGPDGLAEMIGKSGYEILVTIGYEPEYLKHKVDEGNQFKLVVVPEGTAVLATTGNLIDLVCKVYPDVAGVLNRHRDDLDPARTPFAEIERQAGFRFLDVEKAGKADRRFMTYERFRAGAGTLADARAFLYFSVHIRELFRGDGRTDVNGQPGPYEFIAPNMRIDQSGQSALLDLTVKLPLTAPAVHTARTLNDVLGFQRPELMHSLYVPNLALARKEGRKARQQHGLKSAHQLREKNGGFLSILIDAEDDFSDVGRLPVKGTFSDMARWTNRFVKSVLDQVLTDVIVTIDVHPVHAIHNDSWWEDTNGNAPDVTIPTAMELVDANDRYPFVGKIGGQAAGRYRPRIMREYTVQQYAPHLKATGQGDIWVFADHCRQGTDGVNLLPAIVEALEWASAALDLEPMFMYKGMLAQTDWFGPFCPCLPQPRHPQGGLQTKYLDMIRKSRRTEVAGEAMDFCVKAGMLQILDYYQKPEDLDVRNSINFLMDCTSPIFPDPVVGVRPNADFVAQMKASGIKMVNNDSSFF